MNKGIFRRVPTLILVSALSILLSECVDDNLEKLAKKSSSGATTSNSSSTSSSSATATATATGSATSGQSGSTTGSGTATGSGSGSASGSSTTVSFVKDVQPILSKYKCANCHGTFYSNYSGAHSLAVTGLLYGTMSRAAGYRPMPPGQIVSTAELAIIKKWVDEGAPNN
ncbi:MAG: hypothetical protein JST46_17585 [Bacteroidetes bacterium]|nr:hypothetical protein [Bacteroidota bacterium]